ncbi:hypothetical protein FE257_010806 [Aspergillus nanangensis]|uniref:Uncharacterized protein n=1 Tax=Aspergillus nanangensis TaxID=2582783 RepID=A0AAD4CVI9_ASPNN|nr:hypothetical protein FE257_010806 [Aspergillus nanangensis]
MKLLPLALSLVPLATACLHVNFNFSCGGSAICGYGSASIVDDGNVICRVPNQGSYDFNCNSGYSATLTPGSSTYRLDYHTPHGFYSVEVPFSHETWSCCSTPFCMDTCFTDRSVDNGYFC